MPKNVQRPKGDTEMNRVIKMIASQEANIKAKAPTLAPGKLAELNRNLSMAFDEYCSFQNLKSLAVASGTLTLEEGQTVYGYLGNTVEHFNDQSLAVKIVLTKLYAELLERKMPKKVA